MQCLQSRNSSQSLVLRHHVVVPIQWWSVLVQQVFLIVTTVLLG